MTRAQFAEKRPKTQYQSMDGQTWVQICLHEQKVTVKDPETGRKTGVEYAYDFNEFHDTVENIDKIHDDIEADPEKYLDYQPAPAPEPEPPAPEDLRDQVETNSANIDYIAMMTGVEI